MPIQALDATARSIETGRAQDPRLPRARARAGRRSRGRRHHRDRRPDRRHRRQHDRRPQRVRADPRRSRSIRRRCRCASRSTIRRSPGARATRSPVAHDPRPADARGRRQRRHQGAPKADDKDTFEVAGRGELQLGVLIETMRREGFELGISRPRVLFKPIRDRPAPGADRESRHRRRRGIFRHRRREDRRRKARADRHAPVGRRQDPHHLPRARRAA